MSSRLSNIKTAAEVVSGVQLFTQGKKWVNRLAFPKWPVEEYLEAQRWMLLHDTEFDNLMEQARNDPRCCYSEEAISSSESTSNFLRLCRDYLGWTRDQGEMVYNWCQYRFFLKHHPLLQEGEKIVNGVSELIQSHIEEYENQKEIEEKAREELWMERWRRLGRFVKKVQKKTKEALLYPVW